MLAHRSYAVLWSEGQGSIESGRLEVLADRVEFSGRDRVICAPLSSVTGSRIARDAEDRLRGLPVLSLSCGAVWFRIASLEGTGALYEIARLVDSESPALRVSGI